MLHYLDVLRRRVVTGQHRHRQQQTCHQHTQRRHRASRQSSCHPGVGNAIRRQCRCSPAELHDEVQRYHQHCQATQQQIRSLDGTRARGEVCLPDVHIQGPDLPPDFVVVGVPGKLAPEQLYLCRLNGVSQTGL